MKKKNFVRALIILLCIQLHAGEITQTEIEVTKEHWKEKIGAFEDEDFLQKFYAVFQNGTLIPATQGTGSTYFLLDTTQTPQYVIKPFDESAHCLNNPKDLGSPYTNLAFGLRDHIPLYRSAQAEALAYAVAASIGLEHLTPETHLAVIAHEQFIPREKFCSIQTYVPDLENVRELAEVWLSQDLSDNEILNLIDQTDFENLFLLICLFYDTDAHAGNLYARKDAAGIYHLLKLDNGLTFPNKNRQLFNALYLFPQARRKFSDQAIERIQTLPMEKLTEQFVLFEMEDTLEAFLERVEILKQLTCEADYSLREIDIHFRKLENHRL